MNNELSVALVAAFMTFAFSAVGGYIKEQRQSANEIKKAKSYINDELNIIQPTLTEIDNVLSYNNNPPIQKIQSLNRFTYPSEALKNQIVKLPNESMRKKINLFYNNLYHAVNIDFSGLYSLGNDQDPLVLNERNEIKNKFKELLKSLEEIQSGLGK